MSISATMVKELRERTGAGMMECKRALVEAGGDMETAVEQMRISGLAKADKKAGRVAAEGIIAVASSGATVAMVEVNCETDFVAKNDDFEKFGQEILDIAIEKNPSNIDDFLAVPYDDRSSVTEKITDQIRKIGEKIDLSDYKSISAEKVIAYIHPGNKVSSLVGINKDSEEASAAGKNVAMQVAAMAPIALNEKERVLSS